MADVQLQPLTEFDSRAFADLTEVGPIDFYLREHEQGVGALFAVLDGDKRVGSVLIRREVKLNGEIECVVVAGKVRHEKAILNPGMSLIERYARNHGCKSMRVHTDRVGLINNLLKRNTDAETVVEWRL